MTERSHIVFIPPIFLAQVFSLLPHFPFLPMFSSHFPHLFHIHDPLSSLYSSPLSFFHPCWFCRVILQHSSLRHSASQQRRRRWKEKPQQSFVIPFHPSPILPLPPPPHLLSFSSPRSLVLPLAIHSSALLILIF